MDMLSNSNRVLCGYTLFDRMCNITNISIYTNIPNVVQVLNINHT